MKLTQKAVAELAAADGQDRRDLLRRQHARLRLSPAHRCWRQGAALVGCASIATAVPPGGCCSARPRCSVPSRRAPWPRRRWAVSPTARTRRPTGSTGAARTDIRSRPPSPITWRSRSATVRPRTYTELARYLTARYFGPLHSLALDQITRKDVAARLNRITLESSSIVAARARAQLSRAVRLGAARRPHRGQPGGRHAGAEGRPAARARAVGRRAGANLAGVR